jgi:hypothetical protein
MPKPRILLALVLALTLALGTAVPVQAKGGKSGSSSGSKSSKKHKSSDGCGSGTWIAFPILGGTVLVTRRRRWRRLT